MAVEGRLEWRRRREREAVKEINAVLRGASEGPHGEGNKTSALILLPPLQPRDLLQTRLLLPSTLPTPIPPFHISPSSSFSTSLLLLLKLRHTLGRSANAAIEPLNLLPRTGRVDQGTTRELRLLGFTGCIKGILNSLSGGSARREGSRLAPPMESGYLTGLILHEAGGRTRPKDPCKFSISPAGLPAWVCPEGGQDAHT